MDNLVLIDTNLFLDDHNIIYKLSREYDKVLVPITVLKELDNHKFKPDTSYSARNAIVSIMEFGREYPEKIIFDTEITNKDVENDEKIIDAGKRNGAVLATKDISMSIMAEAEGVKSQMFDVVLNNIFSPYVYVEMKDLHEKTMDDVFAYSTHYEGREYSKLLTIVADITKREISRDQWFFILINVEKEEPVIYANHAIEHSLVRIDNSNEYRCIEVDGTIIKSRDPFQTCAIFALKEAPNVLITGRWGSGKTLLGTAHAISSSRKKTFVTRAPIGINYKYNLGFMPGDKNEKMMDWVQGFLSALYYIYANTRCQTDRRTTYDYVKDKIFKEKFEMLPMNSIQGLSLLDNDVLIVDEAQLITVDYMSMILSRPSETGKLILLGDLKQTYNIVKPSESGLLKLLRMLPHKHLAYIELQNSYRSPLLEVADRLQDRTLV